MYKRHKSAINLAIIGLVLIAIALAASAVIPRLLAPPSNLRLGDGIFKTELALNDTQRAKGLSGRSSLGASEAMLFVFPGISKWKITVKDMEFPIDIVWLDQYKKVVYIVKNASPETSLTDTFEPKSDAKYVVELAAGTVDSRSINIGRTAVFDLVGLEVQ